MTGGAWQHDDVVRLLARETPFAHVDIETAAIQLAALGWTPHQVRRGIHTLARTRLSFDVLWRAVELTGGDVDAVMDALVGSGADERQDG